VADQTLRDVHYYQKVAQSMTPSAQSVVTTVTQTLPTLLDDTLVGIYLFGSLVWGDFDEDTSDIDILVVLRRDVDDTLFTALNAFHDKLALQYPYWAERIELVYISLDALDSFKEKRSPIAVISPGEPFNIKDAGLDWLINWYTIRNQCRVVYGPDPATIIPVITRDEFTNGVRAQVDEWGDWVVHTRESRPYQAYAILTMCRALYVWQAGVQTSKRRAAEWAMQALPEQTGIIANALEWRRDHRNNDINHAATYRFAVEMVRVVSEKMGIVRV
jgi:predicted nucleotidyltransferase